MTTENVIELTSDEADRLRSDVQLALQDLCHDAQQRLGITTEPDIDAIESMGARLTLLAEMLRGAQRGKFSVDDRLCELLLERDLEASVETSALTESEVLLQVTAGLARAHREQEEGA